MNEKVKKITEVFGWMLFLSIYATIIIFVISLVQSPEGIHWWEIQPIWTQILFACLGFIIWCVYTLVMFIAFWGFNALWLWFTKQLLKVKKEIEAIKKGIDDQKQ